MLSGKIGNGIIKEIKPKINTPIIIVSAKDEPDTKEKTINVHISNIRQKLMNTSEEKYTETVWNVCFKTVD